MNTKFIRKPNQINFCANCGNKVEMAIPDGDNRERHVCSHCGEIHYQNPKVIAGCIPVWQDKILLCKRAIEPRYGLWTLPAGFLENGESLEDGAARETWEEALAKVKNIELYQIYNLLPANQIYVLFRAELCDPQGYGVGSESLEVKLVDEEDIPWEEIAFKVIEGTLRRFLKERRHGNFQVQTDTMQLK